MEPEPSALSEVVDQEEQLADLELATFASRFPAVRRISILKLNEQTQRYVHQASAPAEAVTEDFIQTRWKGGTYKLNYHNEAGMVITTRSGIEIADPFEPPLLGGPQGPVAPTMMNTSLLDPITIMREAAQRQHEIQLALITHAKPQSGLDMAGIMPLLTFFKKNEAPQVGMKEMLDVFSKGMEMAKSANGGDGFNWSEIVQALAPSLLAKFGPKEPPQGQGFEEGGEEDLPDMTFFESIVDFVKPAARANTNVDLLVKFVTLKAESDPQQYEALQLFMEQSFAEVLKVLAQVDPEMAQEPVASYLQTFYTKLKDAIHGKTDTERSAGNGSDAANNGGARKAGAVRSDRS